MASTYSPSLRLELMATGDQSGTWGTTTNTNLGTLLEQAITGVLSVAQGDVANLTLTTVNGGSDQARNAIVRISGALTATRNVVVQTAAKLYTIANDTTGGFSIVAKTAAGTGVSIPPGAMIDVYSDGTNVVTGANYWSGQIGGAVYLDAGATVGPVMDLFRDSTSPAASDSLGQVIRNGRDSAGNKQEYASDQVIIVDPTSTSEDAAWEFYVTVGGAKTRFFGFAETAAGAADPNNVGLPKGQLSFPATQNPSSDPNTLDDYEEGTFTASVFQSSQLTVTTTAATYTKTGNQVHLESISSITSAGSLGVIVEMNGAPFAAAITGTSFSVLGTFQYLDNGTAYYVGSAIWIALLAIAGQTNNTGNQLGTSPSLAAASGDVLSISVNYRV